MEETGSVIFGCIVVSIIVLWIAATIRRFKKIQNNLKKLNKEGFDTSKTLHRKHCSIAFDINNREVAFVFKDGICKYSFDDVSRWKHTWTDKTVNGRIQRENNIITFDLKDLDRPTIKINLHSHREGEDWMSRLNTMLNG